MPISPAVIFCRMMCIASVKRYAPAPVSAPSIQTQVTAPPETAIRAGDNIRLGGAGGAASKVLNLYAKHELVAHFVCNIRGMHLAETHRVYNPEHTCLSPQGKLSRCRKLSPMPNPHGPTSSSPEDKAHITKHFVASPPIPKL